MLIFSAQSLVYIAVPKTGSTAVEMALKPKADIIFTKNRKHTTAQRFHRKIAPFLKNEFGLQPERFAVIREPEEQIRSWYRYRARDAKRGSEFSTAGISFDQFVREVISETPPSYAGIGSQWSMLASGRGAVLVEHLFAHERPLKLGQFLDDRFGEPIILKEKNVSPTVSAELDPKTRALLKSARADEFALYNRVMEADGHLFTPVG